jgi:hypothetical protein
VAEQIIRKIVDDLDGSEADESIRFAFEGRPLVIDLSKKNADKFRKAIQPFIDAARPDRDGATPRRAASKGGKVGYDAGAIRVWAAEKGIAVPARGKIKKEIVDQYHAEVGR